MSGQQIGAVAGQVIGAYVGGLVGAPTVGAALGGAIGGAIGGSFDPDILLNGPRLTDLHVQSSTYGNAVPIIYGTVRIAGNVIWSSDIRETAIDSEVEAKGGPTTTQREFSYDLDAAISICEGVTTGIERIFANGVLVYDRRTGVTPATVYAGGLWIVGMKFYNGSETQLVDPTIEAAVGVGNAQAYRGTSYVLMQGIQLNVLKTATLPSFEFVIAKTGTITQYVRKFALDNISPSYGVLGGDYFPRVRLVEGVLRVDNDTDAQVHLYSMEGDYLGMSPQDEFEAQRPATRTGPIFGFWRLFDGTNVNISTTVGINPRDLQIGATLLSSFITGSPSRQFVSFTQCKDNASIIALVGDASNPSGYADEWIRFRWTGGEDGEVLIDDRGTVALGLIGSPLGPPTATTIYVAASFAESDLKTIWSVYGAGIGHVNVYQINDAKELVLLKHFAGVGESIFDYAAFFSAPSIYADEGLAFIVAGDSIQIYSRLPEIAESSPTLGDVVADLCERSGVTSTERNTAALTEEVEGFVIAHTMSARAAIETLRPGYYFDAVDGDTLKFVLRGGASATTFEYYYLGAGEGDARPVAVSSKFAQETELPSRVNVRYISKSADYQVGAQSARRETTGSQEILDAEMPIVFTDARAAEVADVNLRDRWAGSTVRQWSTTLRYSKYEPTDVIDLDDGLVVRKMRIVRRVDRGAMIEWEGRDEDAATYLSNAAGMTLSVPIQTLSAPGPTELEALDIPPLTELADGNESAAYVGAKGLLSGWAGAVVEISRDNGATFVPGTTVTTASVMGATSTALPNFLGGNVFDEASVVRVNVGAGTLSSSTHTAVLNGANPAAVGDEIIQFRTATLIAAGIYDLSGLLRGRKGTEWAISTHVEGERFVMLTSRLRNIPLLIADRVAQIYLRATTSGTYFGSAAIEAFSPQIARLMPYSPSHLSATRNADGSWYLSWLRRDRYMNDWNDGVDVPMSEYAELYDVEILNVGGEVVEIYTDVADEFLTVPNDVLGGSPTPASLTFRVFQKSAIVGRGFEAEATINQAL